MFKKWINKEERALCCALEKSGSPNPNPQPPAGWYMQNLYLPDREEREEREVAIMAVINDSQKRGLLHYTFSCVYKI